MTAIAPETRVIGSVLVSFAIVVAAGGPVIRWLASRKIGDRAEFDNAEVNSLNQKKVGTPTMGGILMVGAIAAATLLFCDPARLETWLALACLLGSSLIGLYDDWLKLTRPPGEPSRQGLTSGKKILLQCALYAAVAYFALQGHPRSDITQVPVPGGMPLPLSFWPAVVLAALTMVGFSNAVNLSDGMDGLASGLTILCILGLLAFFPGLTIDSWDSASPLGVLVLMAAVVGGVLGFLWFNAHPARVFMGDTGSLALGGVIGYIAVMMRHELVLLLVGGVLVAEALSVMIQVGYFKYTRIRTGQGQRVFRMSPIHHHFRLGGWPETRIVQRFWIIGALLTLAAWAIASCR